MAFENKKILKGRVIKQVNSKTVTVLVSTKKPHPIYKKRINVSKKYLVHDENNEVKLNDVILIKEHRPLSARKRFIFVKKIMNKQSALNNNPKLEKEQ